jgi:hypothetical protein
MKCKSCGSENAYYFDYLGVTSIRCDDCGADLMPGYTPSTECNPKYDIKVIESILCPADASEITLGELKEMCKAKREGRVVELKVKPYETVYFIDEGKIAKGEITRITFWENDSADIMIDGDDWYCTDYTTDDIGKTVFLTREAAEAALAKEGEGK